MDTTQKLTVALVETAAQVKTILESPEIYPGVDKWIPLAPEAARELGRRNIAYSRLEDHYRESEMNAFADEVMAAQHGWVGWIDDYLQRHIPLFGEAGFLPARCWLYFLKICLDSVSWRVFVLQSLAESVSVGTVLAGAAADHRAIDDRLWFDESVWAHLMPVWAHARSIPLITIAATTPPSLTRPQVEPRTRRFWRARGLAGIPRRIARKLRRVVAAAAATAAAVRRAKWPCVAILQGGYDVAFVEPELVRRKLRPVHWRNLAAPRHRREPASRQGAADLALVWAEVLQRQEFREPLSCRGIDFAEVVESRLRHWWHHVIPVLWQACCQARAALERERPAALVTALAYDTDEIAALHMAKLMGIPTFMYQHGAHFGKSPIWGVVDGFFGTHSLTYGDEVCLALAESYARCPGPRALPVAVGSARLDHVDGCANRERARSFFGVAPQTTVVLYVATHIRGNVRCWGNDDYPSVSYSELQFKVIDLFRRYPGTQFYWKAFVDESPNPALDVLAGSDSPAVLLNYGDPAVPPLTEIMWGADVIIIDSPSTGLLEALLTKAEIVVYSDRDSLRIRPEVIAQLARRVRLARTQDELLAVIGALLLEGPGRAAIRPNDELLRSNGTLEDGRSAARAAVAIRRVIDERAAQSGSRSSGEGG